MSAMRALAAAFVLAAACCALTGLASAKGGNSSTTVPAVKSEPVKPTESSAKKKGQGDEQAEDGHDRHPAGHPDHQASPAISSIQLQEASWS